MLKSGKIFRIPEAVSIKIAAGEVIERPASVVKELVENSIDSGADNIDVEIIDGGKKLIKVADNGCGIDKDDVRLSIERFTTSKLKISDSLLEDIETLGFRGEALASIASVSHLTLKSRTEDSDVVIQIYAEAGKIKDENQMAGPKGTGIEIKNLFYNFPARRKFLKTDKTEQGHIETLFGRVAFPYFDRNFSLTANGKKILNFKAGESFSKRTKEIFSSNALPNVEFEHTAGQFKIEGIITGHGIDFPTSANIIIYVNGRFVKDRIITHAVTEALRTHISHGKYPGGIIYLSIPTDSVDVNVHPTKAEVKFKDSNFIHGFVLKSIQSSLSPNVHSRTNLQTTETDRDPFKPFSFDFKAQTSYPKGFGFKNLEEIRDFSPMEKSGYFSNLSVLGQLKNSYIICGDEKGVVIIDQHAAHERVTFENLKSGFAKKAVPIQNLLFPMEFEIKGSKGEALRENLDQFRKFGFLVEEFGGNSFILRGVPEILINTDHLKTINDILEMMAEFSSNREKDKLIDEILETMACHSSVSKIKGGI